MSPDEIKDLLSLMEEKRKELKGDREASRRFLVDAGIFTKSGNLTKPYRKMKNSDLNVKISKAEAEKIAISLLSARLVLKLESFLGYDGLKSILKASHKQMNGLKEGDELLTLKMIKDIEAKTSLRIGFHL